MSFLNSYFAGDLRSYIAQMLCLALALLAGCKDPPVPSSAGDADKLAALENMIEQQHDDFPEVVEIRPERIQERLAAQNVVLVDVREAKEQAVSMIPGAITRADFESQRESFAGKQVVTYCTIGYRSGRYAQKLLKAGIDVENLRGSILAWTHAGLPLVTPEGEPTHRVHVYGSQWNLVPEGYEAVY